MVLHSLVPAEEARAVFGGCSHVIICDVGPTGQPPTLVPPAPPIDIVTLSLRAERHPVLTLVACTTGFPLPEEEYLPPEYRCGPCGSVVRVRGQLCQRCQRARTWGRPSPRRRP